MHAKVNCVHLSSHAVPTSLRMMGVGFLKVGVASKFPKTEHPLKISAYDTGLCG